LQSISAITYRINAITSYVIRVAKQADANFTADVQQNY
jgi:hypothetical protein